MSFEAVLRPDRRLAGKMREGLIALSVDAGLRVMDKLIERELVGLGAT